MHVEIDRDGAAVPGWFAVRGDPRPTTGSRVPLFVSPDDRAQFVAVPPGRAAAVGHFGTPPG